VRWVASIGALGLMGGSLETMFTAVSGQLDTAVNSMPST
jgi:Flp pilus assembly pilin Flp